MFMVGHIILHLLKQGLFSAFIPVPCESWESLVLFVGTDPISSSSWAWDIIAFISFRWFYPWIWGVFLQIHTGPYLAECC